LNSLLLGAGTREEAACSGAVGTQEKTQAKGFAVTRPGDPWCRGGRERAAEKKKKTTGEGSRVKGEEKKKKRRPNHQFRAASSKKREKTIMSKREAGDVRSVGKTSWRRWGRRRGGLSAGQVKRE